MQYRPAMVAASLNRTNRRSVSRIGITLVEVLASVCILSVGVLGAMTMLPLANFYKSEANKFDRTTTLADEAFMAAQVRGALDPAKWIGQAASSPVWAAPGGFPNSTLPDMSIAIVDPLGVAMNGGNVPTSPPAAYSITGSPQIPRLTVAINADPNGPVLQFMPQALADRLFRSADDLQFSRPPNGKRPQALPGPQPDSEGSFLFAVMVRRRTLLDPSGKVAFEPINAVIEMMAFEKRDLALDGPTVASPPPERMLYADINNVLPAGNLNVQLRGPAGWAETKRMQPILLSVQITDPTAPSGSRTFAEWYLVKGGNGANLVLQGPDWPAMNVGWTDADATTPQPTVFATIFDGLVLVKEAIAED